MTAGSPSPEMSWAIASAVFPFLAAIAFVALSPQLVARVKRAIRTQISEDRARLGIQPDTYVQPQLSPKEIDEYLDYTADAIQILPVSLLPVLGAVFAISKDSTSVPNLLYLGVAVIVAIVLDVLVLNRSTSDYVSRKRWGYSIVAWVAFLSNIAGLFVVLSAYL